MAFVKIGIPKVEKTLFDRCVNKGSLSNIDVLLEIHCIVVSQVPLSMGDFHKFLFACKLPSKCMGIKTSDIFVTSKMIRMHIKTFTI